MAQWADSHKKDSSRLIVGAFRLMVHHYIGYPPEQFLASCHGVFERKELKSITLDEAKTEAANLLCKHLKDALGALESTKKG